MIRRLIPLAFGLAGPAAAATITLDTTMFPSGQGWGICCAIESEFASIQPAGLQISTIDSGNPQFTYFRALPLARSYRYELIIEARIDKIDDLTGKGERVSPFGFGFRVNAPGSTALVGLAGPTIGFTSTASDFADFAFPAGYLPRGFNKYVLSGGNGVASLYVNGVPIFIDKPTSPIGVDGIISFGDEGGSTNTAATIRRLAFVSQVPEPGTWAMLIAGFGLVGAVMRRRGRAHAVTGPRQSRG